jgi:hypothetical protein
MPHVVIEGQVPLEVLFEEFEAFQERRGADIVKVTDMYLNRGHSLALLDCVVVEGRPKTFLMMLDRKPESLTVRLYPPTDPEKSDGVRRLIALVARKVVTRFSGCVYGANNIESFLIRE